MIYSKIERFGDNYANLNYYNINFSLDIKRNKLFSKTYNLALTLK